MKLYEVAYPQLEAERKARLTRELMDAGWDVWTDFRYGEACGKETVFDVLARRGEVIRVYELVAAGKKDTPDVETLRCYAEENGWEFQLVEVDNPTSATSESEEQLASLQRELQAASDARSHDTNTTVEKALDILQVTLAEQIIRILIRRAAVGGQIDSSGDILNMARGLVDKSLIDDQIFERIARFLNMRNVLVHNPTSSELSDQASVEALALVAMLSSHLNRKSTSR